MRNLVKAIARIFVGIGLIIAFFALSMTDKFDDADFLRTFRNVFTMLVLLSPVLYIHLTGWADDSEGRSFKAFSIIITEIFAVVLITFITALFNAEDIPVGVVIVICAARPVYSIVLELAATAWEHKADCNCVRQVKWRTNQIAKAIFIYYVLFSLFFSILYMHPSDEAFGLALNRIVFVLFYELVLKFMLIDLTQHTTRCSNSSG